MHREVDGVISGDPSVLGEGALLQEHLPAFSLCPEGYRYSCSCRLCLTCWLAYTWPQGGSSAWCCCNGGSYTRVPQSSPAQQCTPEQCLLSATGTCLYVAISTSQLSAGHAAHAMVGAGP